MVTEVLISNNALESNTMNSILDDYDVEFRSVVKSANKTVASDREMDKYFNEEYLDRKDDPLVW